MSVTALSLAAMAAMVAWAAGSPSEPEPETVAVGLSFEAGIPTREQTPLRESFDRILPIACEPIPCVDDCAEGQSSLGVRVGGNSRDYALHWVATDPRLDAPLILDTACELCSLGELEEQLATDLTVVCTRLAALEVAPSRVHIRTDPDGASVRIDGRVSGRSPWLGELAPGEHHVEIRASGYRPQQRTLQVLGGIEEIEDFELLPNPGRGRPAWPGWTSLGMGVALSVAGTALIVMQGKEWPAKCSGVDLDVNGRCRYVYATRNLGIGLAVGGAAMFASGVGLVVWAQHGQYSAGLAWRGNF